jgi:hypothetical protein
MRTPTSKWIERVAAVAIALLALAVTIPSIRTTNGTETLLGNAAFVFYVGLSVVSVALIIFGSGRLRLNMLGWIVLGAFFLLAIMT